MIVPLTLKRQRAASSPKRELSDLIAEVIVDNGVYHLDETFLYAVPIDLENVLRIGAQVKVPFQDRTCTGIVWKIRNAESSAKLKVVAGVIDTMALSQQMIEICDRVVERYACSRHDVLRFMDGGMKSLEILEIPQESEQRSQQRIFHKVKDGSVAAYTANLLSTLSGRILVVCDTKGNADAVIVGSRGIRNPVFDLGTASRSAFRKTAGDFRKIKEGVAIGMRSLILTSLGFADHIIVLNEWSEHHWERKSPYWNTRDVALIRAESEGSTLHFISGTPSLELARLLDTGYLKKARPKAQRQPKPSLITFAPESFHRVIAAGLTQGNVLVSVASKTYVGALICRKCRTKALCSCGGSISETSSKKFDCAICLTSWQSLKCSECRGIEFLMMRKGAQRLAVEIGKAFPHARIDIATSDTHSRSEKLHRTISIATTGMEPAVPSGYFGVVLLDGEFLTSMATLRSEEQTWHRWNSVLQFAAPGAAVHISLPRAHVISQDLSLPHSDLYVQRSLSSRADSQLPPYYRMVSIGGEASSLRNLAHKLGDEISRGVEIFPVSSEGKLWVKVTIATAPQLLAMLRVVQRYRAASKRNLFMIKVDPYEI